MIKITIVTFCGPTNVFDFAVLPRKHHNLTFNVSVPETSVRVALTTAAVAGDEVTSPFLFFYTIHVPQFCWKSDPF